ncbi:MAG: endonuclease/exonuclease/phosphatase family protein [Kiritimatiellae bacterium]|jgi:endonuclease/exonuclease/phosphatase (EEP) superfamily protein YafD|nr:endonuclease/exonuclease/phosphatase family protein [Kiritimatiellia bacterium]
MNHTKHTETSRIISKSIMKFIAGCIDAAATVGVLVTAAGLLGKTHWFMELMVNFKLPLAICFLGYTIYKLTCRNYKIAALSLIPFLINAIPPALLLIPQQHQTAPINPTALRILQANILSSNQNSDALLELIEECDPDIIVLQEINRRWVEKLNILRLKYPVSATFPRADNFGAGIFCKQTNATAKILFLSDRDQLPLSRIELTLNNKTVTITGAHPLAPLSKYLWKWRNLYTKELAEQLTNIEGPQILTGDLNTTPWANNYKSFVKKSGLLDSSQGRGALSTWPVYQPFVRLPLDHCFHSKDVIIKSRKRGPNIGSDHFPLIIDAVF